MPSNGACRWSASGRSNRPLVRGGEWVRELRDEGVETPCVEKQDENRHSAAPRQVATVWLSRHGRVAEWFKAPDSKLNSARVAPIVLDGLLVVTRLFQRSSGN